MDKLEAGKIVNTHGLRGQVKIVPWCDYPEQFEDFKELFLSDGSALTIKEVKYQKSNIIVSFKEITTVEMAEKLKNQVVLVKRAAFKKLPENTYFIKDLLGLEVIDLNGQSIGRVSDVFPAGGSDVYVVKKAGRQDVLIPAIKENIREIDIKNGRIIVSLMEGLMD